jgi:hypothetical protein
MKEAPMKKPDRASQEERKKDSTERYENRKGPHEMNCSTSQEEANPTTKI